MTHLLTLPCYPCPHGSACCRYGAELSSAESLALRVRFGDEAVAADPDRPGEYRTSVVAGGCFFLAANSCRLHATDLFPAICEGFPHRLGRSAEPYPYDRTICPELSQPGVAPMEKPLTLTAQVAVGTPEEEKAKLDRLQLLHHLYRHARLCTVPAEHPEHADREADLVKAREALLAWPA